MNTYTRNFLFSSLVVLAGLTAAFTASPARAQIPDQLYGLYGEEVRNGTSPTQKTYFFEFEYMHDLNNTFSLAFDNCNLGHFNQGIEHHIDCGGPSAWVHHDFLNNNLRLAAGVGAELYYDTTGGTYMHADEDVHGLGTNEGITATWLGFAPLLLQVRASAFQTGTVKTEQLSLGVGLELGGNNRVSRFLGGDPSTLGYPATNNEVTIFGLKSTLNEPGNGHGTGFAVEYRRDMNSFIQLSETVVDEGKSQLADRKGLMTEAWLDKSFFSNRLNLALGAGIYAYNDPLRPGGANAVSPVRSYSIAYNISEHFDVRATWDRPITNDGRDSDIARVGFGYRF